MKFGVAFQTAFSSMGGTTELIEFEDEAAAQSFIDEMQPAAGVQLSLVRFSYSTYEVVD